MNIYLLNPPYFPYFGCEMRWQKYRPLLFNFTMDLLFIIINSNNKAFSLKGALNGQIYISNHPYA